MSNARATTPDWDFSLFPTDEDRWGTKAVLLFRLDSPDKCKESPRSTYDRGRELGRNEICPDTLARELIQYETDRDCRVHLAVQAI